MSGPADRYTDKTFSQLESRISKMYREAQKDLRQKLADFTRHHKIKDAEMLRKLKAGEITQAQYQQWITGQVFVGNQWKQKIEQINTSIKNLMQEASNLSHGKSMDVFAENANYTAYQLERDLKANINFGLYDASTVSRLVGRDPEILPRRVVNGEKLEAWETKKISNAISQGIIQGEGIDQIADRIARDTCIAADKSSVMYARTAITAAQNAGRIERLHEAEEMGIRVQKRWMATLDNRTRDSHAELDGQTVDVDEDFVAYNRDGSVATLAYPGDPSAPFEQICNCRCTMVYVYPDFQQSFERSAFAGYDKEGHKQYETVGDMTYREWQKSKQPQREEVVPSTKFGYMYGESTAFPVIDDVTGMLEEHSMTVTKRPSYGFPDGTDGGIHATRDADVYTLDDGTQFIFPSDLDSASQTATPDLLIRQYYQLPDSYRRQIQKTVHVLDYRNEQDKFWEKEYGISNFRSYATGGRDISFYASTYHDEKYLVKTFAHEGAHYIDLYAPNATKISESKEWADAMLADLAEHGLKAPTDYAKSSNHEDFAESVAEYLTDKQMMETQFPHRTAIIRRVLGE